MVRLLTQESPLARYRDVAPLKRFPNLRPRLALWLAWAELCLARAAERRHLSGLSDHELKDIGLSRADVEREGRRWRGTDRRRGADPIRPPSAPPRDARRG